MSYALPATAFLLLAYALARYFRKIALPPGPRGLPLIGNMLDMPLQEEYLTFSKWGRIYGNIMSLNVLGQPIVILNSYKHACELLEKRSAGTADRPVFVMGGEMVGWSQSLALTPYGERFKSMRKFLHQFIGTKAKVEAVEPTVDLETRRLLRRLAESPGDLVSPLQKTQGAIILKATYGYTPKEDKDALIEEVHEAMGHFSLAIQPGAWLVDVLPFLRYLPPWIPGTGFQATAANWKKTLHAVAQAPFRWTKSQMASGRDVYCFISTTLEDTRGLDEDLIQWIGLSLYTGGTDTTVAVMSWFILAMVLFPEVQARAQAEIDTVVGHDRFPTIQDRSQLPYMDALVKELLRWRPIGPLALPHRLTEDQVYETYFLPKGTIVLPNIWCMCHDLDEYPNPEEFRPERHLSQVKEGVCEPARDPMDFVFGFGRRKCPGHILADITLWLACTRILASMNITAHEDPVSGQKILPDTTPAVGLVLHPKPFSCSIRPRTGKAAELVASVRLGDE